MPSERVQKKIDSLLNEAEEAVTRNDWAVVRERAHSVLTLDRTNADATHYLGAAEEELSSQHASAPNLPKASIVETPAPSQVQPTSFSSGRYTVRKLFGEGGKKRVYLAHDTVLDRDVAFALIKTEGLDDAARTRITREAQAMGRLGDHPNIMPIFDLGQETDPASGVQQPFMVLPIMTGGDVEGVIEKAPEHKMPLERALQIARETASGLVFAHSKGIVHRDLKPGNVWLTADGTARIGDFGLAVATDRSRLTREGMMVGTVAYMPPEQAMGGEITPKADLYSLGAMLYEMVTGRPPFLGDDDIAIIGQHINTPPVAPTWHRPDCPKTLDSLIMRLLAKDPKQRPESAKDVLAALEGVSLQPSPASSRAHGAAEGEGKTDGTLRSAQGDMQGRSLDSMSSGVFVGRQKEMDQLKAALEEALSGHGRMLTLVGEPGIGKTRTAQELATYAGLRRAQVLWGRCYEGGGAPPYWPWVQAIRSYVLERNPEDLRREMGSTASVIAEVVSDVKERLPGLQPPPQLDSPESARFRLFDSIATFLKTASKSQPLLIILDDLHWSDKPSLLLLEFVARELANSRLLVIGTYRDMELNRKHPLAITLGDLARERLFEKVLLRGLQKHDVERFIELASGIKPPSGLVDAVQTQTEGNPLFVTEVVRLLVQEGHLARHFEGSEESRSGDGALRQAGTQGRGKTGTHSTGSGQAWTVRIPEGVKEVIGRRLDRLSDRCNDVLTTAAVIGRQFSLAALVKLYADPKLSAEERLSEDRLLELMEEALAARIIEELPSGPGRYQFTHALMQETLTSELSTTRKVRLHARIALALEELYGDRADDHAAELAGHFAEAEAVLGTEKLVKYCLIAGEKAFEVNAFEGALEYFKRANDALGDSKDLRKAQALGGIGKSSGPLIPESAAAYQAAWDTLVRAFDLYVSLGRPDSAAKLADAQYAFGSLRGTASLLERALQVVEPGSNRAGWLLARYGIALMDDRGDFSASRQRFDDAMAIARRTGDRKLQARVTVHMAQAAEAEGAFQRCLDLGGEAQRLAREAGDTDGFRRIPPFVARSHVALGQGDEAIRVYEQALNSSVLKASRSSHEGDLSVELLLAQVRSIKGDFGSAAKVISSAEHLTRLERWVRSVRLQVGIYRDPQAQLPSLREDLIALEEADNNVFTGMVARSGFVAFVIEDVELASRLRKAVERNLSLPQARLPRRIGPLFHALGWAAAAQGVQEDAKRAYDSLIGRRGLADGQCGLSIDHTLAVLATVLDDNAAASGHFRDAIEFLRKAGYRPELGWALANYGDFLAKTEPADLARQATPLLDEALTIARDLSMKPLIERILRRRQFLKA